MMQVIPSKRINMNSREYTRYSREQAAEWGSSVPFWIRANEPKQAGRRARFAARWALKILGRQE